MGWPAEGSTATLLGSASIKREEVAVHRSGQILRNRAAAVLAALILGTAGMMSPTTAQADTVQQICSSSGSVIGSAIEVTTVAYNTVDSVLHRSDCVYAGKGEYRMVFRGAKSYRVGYNHGPYSKDCRTNNGFVPWTKADIIYFRLYTSASCINP